MVTAGPSAVSAIAVSHMAVMVVLHQFHLLRAPAWVSIEDFILKELFIISR